MGKLQLRCVLALLLVTVCAPSVMALTVAAGASPTQAAIATSASAVSTATIPASGSAVLAARIAALEKQTADANLDANNAWMLTCAVFVLMMTGPGLALFYGGLVRKKNVLGTMMQSFAMMAIVTVIWALFSFSLAFAPGTSIIGGLKYVFLRAVGGAPNTAYAMTIPFGTFMIYQLMFAIITPALISGAFAERMKFSAMALFMALWSIVVYCPMAHMVWGTGGLLNAVGGRFPTLDFAGGTVVHVTSGVSALVCALYLGCRMGHGEEPMPPHSMVLSFIGACMLWVGWFGFNAGSALSAGTLATSAFIATQLAAAAGALTWTAAEWLRQGKPSALGSISGAIAGLATITPAAGYVGPMAALAIGALTGGFCYFMVVVAKAKFGYDDSLDAFGIHGAGGMLGTVLTGVFASSMINPVFQGGHLHQVMNQLIAVGIGVVLAATGTMAILKFVDLTIGLRVSQEHEALGLDLSQHGEEGYYWEVPA